MSCCVAPHIRPPETHIGASVPHAGAMRPWQRARTPRCTFTDTDKPVAWTSEQERYTCAGLHKALHRALGSGARPASAMVAIIICLARGQSRANGRTRAAAVASAPHPDRPFGGTLGSSTRLVG